MVLGQQAVLKKHAEGLGAYIDAYIYIYIYILWLEVHGPRQFQEGNIVYLNPWHAHGLMNRFPVHPSDPYRCPVVLLSTWIHWA